MTFSFMKYYVDYFDATGNIVVEYDETSHYNSRWELTKKDVERQAEIKNLLGCRFFRYNEVLNIFYEV